MKRSIALLIAVIGFCLAGCSTTHQSKQYEYMKVYDMDAVNKNAAQGWKVVGYASRDVISNGSEAYILERRIRK